MAQDGALFGWVAMLLRPGWSPEQISGRRERLETGVEQPSGLPVSHEAIYTAICALSRGELRRELISYLRQDKPVRGRKLKGSERRGKLCNMTNIKERPEEIEGRLVPGHWKGDIILGAGGASAQTRTRRGGAARTKTPTPCCTSNFRTARRCRASIRRTSISSLTA